MVRGETMSGDCSNWMLLALAVASQGCMIRSYFTRNRLKTRKFAAFPLFVYFIEIDNLPFINNEGVVRKASHRNLLGREFVCIALVVRRSTRLFTMSTIAKWELSSINRIPNLFSTLLARHATIIWRAYRR